MTCDTTCRTRASSSRPLTVQALKSCLASRRDCLLTFISANSSDSTDLLRRFFRQTFLVVSGQDLAGDGRGGLHHEPADFAFEFDQHASMIGGGGFAGF